MSSVVQDSAPVVERVLADVDSQSDPRVAQGCHVPLKPGLRGVVLFVSQEVERASRAWRTSGSALGLGAGRLHLEPHHKHGVIERQVSRY